MVYIVKRLINGKPYYYLKESKRFGKKVVSKCIAYIGKKRPTKAQVKAKVEQLKQEKESEQDRGGWRPLTRAEKELLEEHVDSSAITNGSAGACKGLTQK